ncbi:MAG TPA: BRO family protein [Desulfosalsimonadaceae bacterium]|nr:BRO family protein [Desulfosalsimonadaceae bacterium]
MTTCGSCKFKGCSTSESGLYKLILRSDKSEALEFQDHVASEILPSIRKHGGYIKGQAQMTDDELMARALVLAQSNLEENGDNHNRSGRQGAKASLPEKLSFKIRGDREPAGE